MGVKIDFSQEHKALAKREDEFRGKHVIVVGDKIWPFEDGEEGLRILEHVRREYPDRIPLVIYVMKGEAVYPSIWKHYVHYKVGTGGCLWKQ